ncbi:MAG: S-layer homology domain-containing protein [Oscillospiraceae bacterium]|nr:S-layer homology domain-containing protein [Oscillospiraceae bacterium]
MVVAWAKAKGLINGTDWGGIHPGGYATRAETAAILMRFCENAIK